MENHRKWSLQTGNAFYRIQVSSTNPASIPYRILGYEGIFFSCYEAGPKELLPVTVTRQHDSCLSTKCFRDGFSVECASWSGDDGALGDDRTLPFHLSHQIDSIVAPSNPSHPPQTLNARPDLTSLITCSPLPKPGQCFHLSCLCPAS